MVSHIGFWDTSSNYLNVYPKLACKSGDAVEFGDETVDVQTSTMETCHQPLHKEAAAPLFDESFMVEDYNILADASMERCVESIIRSQSESMEPVVFSEEAKPASMPIESLSSSSVSNAPVTRVRRRSPIVEVTIDSDNDGHERETVLAGHVHIEEDGASCASDISCDDESECEFFRLCDYKDVALDDGEDISIGVFIELLSIAQEDDDEN